MRKMASVRVISEIRPIENADAIEVAKVDNWNVVVKKDEFKVGDKVIYCEIDSWIPTELAPFLSKGKEPREFNEVKGERLKSVKLRGQISQGLILPLTIDAEVGDDVSEQLNIQKWEPPLNAQLQGLVKGNFPSHLFPKSDQERVQNCYDDYSRDYVDHEFEMTMKLDGTSFTAYKHEGEFGVCSRNLELKESDNNSYWDLANDLNLREILPDGFMIQGEMMGEGIQKNQENLTGHHLFVFDVWDIKEQKYLDSDTRIGFVKSLGLKHVPVLGFGNYLKQTFDEILGMADGESLNKSARREGIVFKSLRDPSVSFKAISNKWLLKNE